MSKNDVIILNSILMQKRTQFSDNIDEDLFFLQFAIDQTLKDKDLSNDDIVDGISDGGDDGGIDGLYLFLNNELFYEDILHERIKRSPNITAHIIQCKDTESFKEVVLDKQLSTINDLFDLNTDIESFTALYNYTILQKFSVFRKLCTELASKFPDLSIKFHYITKGDTNAIHPKIREKSIILKHNIQKYFPNAEVSYEFIGARELIDFARKEKTYTLQLNFLEQYISRSADNYIIISNVCDYYDFCTDEENQLRTYLFDSNVRDYLGDVEVNQDIRETLETRNNNIDFWWLNNGITIIASRASVTGKTINLDDVQIVNGLQTSTSIFNYLKVSLEEKREDETRSILVRIVVTSEPETRDKIIKATNFQSKIPDASLRATDRIHRNLEDFFLQNDWYYDRRKNYYKNIGKPSDRIISIPYLAQAMMTVLLKEPDNARARPTTLIKKDKDYEKVFNEGIAPKIYFYCAKSMKYIDLFLRSYPEIIKQYKTNFRFHILLTLMIKITNKKDYTTNDILKIIDNDILPSEIESSTDTTVDIADRYIIQTQSTLEITAKSKNFVPFLIKGIPLP